MIGCFLLSVLARQTWKLDLAAEGLAVSRRLGVACQVLGAAVLLMSYGAMAVARTTIDPSQHSSNLVTSGLYAYSRNPIYQGWFLLIAGIGIRNASVLVLLTAVTMVVLLQ